MIRVAGVCPKSQPWPWATDSAVNRAKRVAHMFRDRLRDEAPAACAEMDNLMRVFGQAWIVEGVPTDPDELLTVRELAEVADVTEDGVRMWVMRWPLTCRGHNDDGRKLYRWGDVIDHQKRKIKRGK